MKHGMFLHSYQLRGKCADGKHCGVPSTQGSCSSCHWSMQRPQHTAAAAWLHEASGVVVMVVLPL
jgi:hypothetical protein